MKRSMVVGISGGSCAGKSYLAERIIKGLNPTAAVLLSQDAYYKDLSAASEEELLHHNFDHPHSFDLPLMLTHLNALLEAKVAHQPVYDFTRHVRTGQMKELHPAPVILVEGILILHYPEMRELMDLTIFLDVGEELRLTRRLKRDTALRGRTHQSVMEQYERSVKPMHIRFVEPTRAFADITVSEGWENTGLLETIKGKITGFLLHHPDYSNLTGKPDRREGSSWSRN